MQIVRTFLTAAVVTLQLHEPPTRSGPVLVTSVVDGHTIQIQTVGRVRLLGIDAPRMPRSGSASPGAARLAREARDRLASLVLHRWVRLERDGSARAADRGGAAYVFSEDGRFVNEVLVREGLARAAPGEHARRGDLQRAEDEARVRRRGIWSAAAGRRTLELPPSSGSHRHGFGSLTQR
jgi:micrococcal nuclease